MINNKSWLVNIKSESTASTSLQSPWIFVLFVEQRKSQWGQLDQLVCTSTMWCGDLKKKKKAPPAVHIIWSRLHAVNKTPEHQLEGRTTMRGAPFSSYLRFLSRWFFNKRFSKYTLRLVAFSLFMQFCPEYVCPFTRGNLFLSDCTSAL